MKKYALHIGGEYPFSDETSPRVTQINGGPALQAAPSGKGRPAKPGRRSEDRATGPTAASFDGRALSTLIGQTHIGLCVVDEEGQAVSMNTAFDRQSKAHQAFQIDRAGRARFHASADQKWFADLLSRRAHQGQPAAGAGPQTLVIPVGDDGEALCIEVIPIEAAPEHGGHAGGGALIISQETRRSSPIRRDLLAEVYGFSDAQTALIELISQGLTNLEIAHLRGRSIETINSQVKAILSKSRVANRTQLVRLAASFTW